MFKNPSLKRKIQAGYANVKNFFFPHYRWLTRRLGRGSMKKEDVITETLFGALVDFWENPQGGERLKSLAFDPYSKEEGEQMKVVYHELHAAYAWAKSRVADKQYVDELKLKFCAATYPHLYPDVDISDTFFPYQLEELRQEMNRKSEDFRKHDTAYLDLILSNRHWLQV